ncbi:hypothetical protein [Celeribacter indicus]|uniref:Uncharacterized protein n=1 Tax=Celeribacter indicus TaxID=1208324 RepID=A0A0B5DXV9_9RHOB|nr:hypothetical protein [Celeribacter indicus]AJE45975.1 hypothetical protein P73_1260 [Celeribacter indicus]SDW65224.1 hypothetical protein SAMN05443573_105208 [Celeribacter indicus]
MSDPMTNMDAEDVLASIRRLVAETHAAPARPPERSAARDRPSALVLTPAFRVADPEPARAAETDPSEAGHRPAEGQDLSPADPESDVPDTSGPLVLSLDQAVRLPDREEAPQPSAAAGPEPVAPAAPQPATEEDWAAKLDDTPAPDAALHAARLTLEQRIAELEAAVGAQPHDWEPDGSEDLEAEIPREMPRAFTEAGARVLRFRALQEDPLSMPFPKEPFDDIADAEVIEEGVASAGPAAADLPPFREEGPQDPAAAEAVAPDPDPSLEEELALAGYAEDDMMDEEALRELVAQVIREELQGDLGRRITRNLRRLVRREVQRALTLREFE